MLSIRIWRVSVDLLEVQDMEWLSGIQSMIQSIIMILLTSSLKSFLLKHEVWRGIKLSIVIFLPKNTDKWPMF
jgi:hypothetical protein